MTIAAQIAGWLAGTLEADGTFDVEAKLDELGGDTPSFVVTDHAGQRYTVTVVAGLGLEPEQQPEPEPARRQ